MTTPAATSLATLLASVAVAARRANVFGDVTVDANQLRCEALASGEPAFYSLQVDANKLWVNLQTPARYLSQSIEQDLVHTGDKIPELLHEELVELGYEGPAPTFEHFRDEAKLYTFRTPVPIDLAQSATPAAIKTATQFLLAYEATFRPLGDMEAGDE
jgi:hypothetical protein